MTMNNSGKDNRKDTISHMSAWHVRHGGVHYEYLNKTSQYELSVLHNMHVKYNQTEKLSIFLQWNRFATTENKDTTPVAYKCLYPSNV